MEKEQRFFPLLSFVTCMPQSPQHRLRKYIPFLRCANSAGAVFNIRKSYTYDTVIILHFYKKRKKNPEYYPGIFSYYI